MDDRPSCRPTFARQPLADLALHLQAAVNVSVPVLVERDLHDGGRPADFVGHRLRRGLHDDPAAELPGPVVGDVDTALHNPTRDMGHSIYPGSWNPSACAPPPSTRERLVEARCPGSPNQRSSTNGTGHLFLVVATVLSAAGGAGRRPSASLAREGRSVTVRVRRVMAELGEHNIEGIEDHMGSTRRRRPVQPGADSPTAMRVIVAEDVLLTRAGIVRLLQDAAGPWNEGEAEDVDGLMAAVALNLPDVVVAPTVRMPPTHRDEGLVAAARCRPGDRGPDLPVRGVRLRPGTAARPPRRGGDLLKERVFDGIGTVLDTPCAGSPTMNA